MLFRDLKQMDRDGDALLLQSPINSDIEVKNRKSGKSACARHTKTISHWLHTVVNITVMIVGVALLHTLIERAADIDAVEQQVHKLEATLMEAQCLLQRLANVEVYFLCL